MQVINLQVSFYIFSITILCISGQNSENVRLSTSQCNPGEVDCSSTCEDIAPPGITLTCEQVSSNNFCNAPNIKSGNFCQKSCGTCGLTSEASPTSCSKYDGKVYVEYNHYDACVDAASNYHFAAKSASTVIACDVARDVENLLRDCQDRATFEAEFISLSLSKFTQYSNPNEWGVRGVGVAFEPYTFEGRPFYSPYQRNGDVIDSDVLKELDYNYYTDCLSSLGDSCTWYHQGKIRTYYDEEGGVWLYQTETSIRGYDYTLEAFYTPVIVDGRFYGLAFADMVYN